MQTIIIQSRSTGKILPSQNTRPQRSPHPARLIVDVDKLNAAMRKAKYTDLSLYDAHNVAAGTLRTMRLGRPFFTSTLNAIADILGTHPSELITYTNEDEDAYAQRIAAQMGYPTF